MKKLLFLLILSISSLLFSQEVTKERLIEVLSYLASDEMKGRNIGTPENDSAAIYIAKQFARNELTYCIGDSYLVPFEYKGKTVYNVCGIKKGKSDKTLAFSAHFDHIGTSENTDDKVFNGADDNASGVTAIIGLADFFKTKKSDFSLMYIAFNGEEKGMKGSKAIVENPDLQQQQQNIAALFNFEMIATVSQFGPNSFYMTGDEFSDVDELFNKYAVSHLKIQADPYPKQKLFYRSDNVNFVKKRTIAHSLSTVDMTKAKHYHQLNDDLEIVDFDNLTKIINNFGKTMEKLTSKNFAPQYTDQVNFD